MRITGIRTQIYEYELARPLGDVHLPHGARRSAELSVRVDTDEGLVGSATTSPAAAATIGAFAERLHGEDPRAVRGLYEEMVRIAFKAGLHGAMASAIAALDCALWDLKAKAAGLPLWKELGASTRRVKAYASGLDMPLNEDELSAFYSRMASDYGIRAGKLKVGSSPERDLDRLGRMRDALCGGGRARPALMIDANEIWSAKQAIARVREIEDGFELAWVEEPVARHDYRGLARVSGAIRSPVASGENLTSGAQFVELIRNESADVLQVGVTTTGITQSLRIAESADAFGLKVALMNCPGRYFAHLAAALPNHLMMEVLDAGRDAVFTVDNALEDGCIVLGDEPGLGLTFDEQRLDEQAVARPSAQTLGSLYRRSAA